MNSDEYSGLQRLKIPIIRWGSNYRIKIRNQYGITTFISNVKNPRNRKLIAKFYKLSEKRINTELDYEYKKPRSYIVEKKTVLETPEFVGFSQDEIYEKVKTFLEGLTPAVKINIQLGFKLIDRTNGLERDYYPSTNTEIWPSTAVAINSKADVERKVMSYMKATDFTERINYPSSAYQLKEINSVKIVIYYRKHSLGDSEIKIPERFSKNHFIINFPKTDNKCVFYSIGYHLATGEKPDRRRVVSHAKDSVKQFCQYENISYSHKVFKEFKPVDIMQFDKLEDCFKVGINVWEMDDETQEILKIRSPGKVYDNTMNILDYNGHAMYITELDYVLNKYPCNGCDAIFDSAEKLRNHKKTKCQLDVLESFAKKPTLYRPSENQIKSLLSKYKVYDIDHYMDHFIVYDFEAILFDMNRESGSNTSYTKRHQAISVSVCDSLTKQVKCFINESPRELLSEMFEYIHEVSKKINKYNFQKWRKVFVMMGRTIRKLKTSRAKYDDGDEKVKILDKIIDKMVKERDSLLLSCSQSPVLGFNSGRNDINLVKNDLFAVLGTDEIKMVIKNPNYMCISTEKLKILDISNYLPAGTSYDQYLKTYLGECQCEDKVKCDCGLGKGMFCYDYLTSYDRIFDEGLPARSAFDSELKGTKCSESEYERLKYVWGHYNMKTVKDLLIWYNNLDVQPFVNAILKQREFYKAFELDMFMDGVSLPGLSEKVMYQICFDNLETVSEGGIEERYYKRVCFEIERLFIKIGGYKVGHEYGVETPGKNTQ